ncbi:2,4-diaminopentanoate dehydrogenase [soil metagenome]|jgi:4-hydroxy-tetrahydrodipicolinate reductase
MLRVVLCGMGGVGRNVVRLSRERPSLRVVGAYSRNPSLLGRDVGELSGGPATGTAVTDKGTALAAEADVLLIATTSFLREVKAEIHDGISAGLDVMCTAEEMAYPWEVDAVAAASIDEHAREAGVTVMGAGANPGYIYEIVGLALTGALWRVDRITTRRVVDLSGFSATVQRRLGIGYSPDDFAAGVRERSVFGHIGFAHTIRTFARRLGMDLERIEETVEPILADRGITTTAVGVAAGESAGMLQRTIGYVDSQPWFSAEFVGHVEPLSAGLTPQDSYEIDGIPNIRAAVTPGFDPQSTTAAALANLLPLLVAAPAGLISVTELPIPTPWR